MRKTKNILKIISLVVLLVLGVNNTFAMNGFFDKLEEAKEGLSVVTLKAGMEIEQEELMPKIPAKYKKAMPGIPAVIKKKFNSEETLKDFILKLETLSEKINTDFKNVIDSILLSSYVIYIDNYVDTTVTLEQIEKVYNKQIAQARDSTRISDIQSLKVAIEMTYQDNVEYPSANEVKEKIKEYLHRGINNDPLEGNDIDGCKAGYYYQVGPDNNGIMNGSYIVSFCLESDRMKEKYKESKLENGMYYLGFSYNDENKNTFSKRILISDGKKVEIKKDEAALEKMKKEIMNVDIETVKTSLRSYKKQAENSKVLSDMGQLVTSMKIKEVEGINIKDTIIRNIHNQVIDISIGGGVMIDPANYIVGTPNYEKLGIKKEDFLSPDGTEYLIGFTSVGGSAYQVASKYYKDGKYIVKISGDYLTRKIEKVNAKKKGNKYVIEDHIGYFKKGDIVSGGGKIISISPNLTELTVEGNVDTEGYLELAKEDSKGLIAIDGKILVDGEPYPEMK